MGSFATIQDLYQFQGLAYPPTPALSTDEELKINADLARASNRVRGYLRLARYVRAADGLPAGAHQRQAIIDATCAQYAYTEDTGKTASGAQGGDFDSVSLIGVSFAKRAGSSNAIAVTGSSLDSPEAQDILLSAGFFTTAVGSGF